MDVKKLIGYIKKKSKEKKRTIIVGDSWDERVLNASEQIVKEGYANIILAGDEKLITKNAKKFKVDISKCSIANQKDKKLTDELSQELYKVRKHKGLTLEQAKELIKNDVNYFAVMHVKKGYADGFGGSAICSTTAMMRPSLQILRKKGELVSEIAIYQDVKNDDRVIFMTDISINIEPDAEQLAQIGVNGGDVAKEFGFKPKIAFLSFSTKGSGKHPSLEPIKKAGEIAKKKRPDYIIDAEYQFDAATNKFAASIKCPKAVIQGDANVLVFPNLMAGNITAHALGKMSDTKLLLGVLKGMQNPCMVFGRSSPLETIKLMIITAAMECNI